MSRRTRSSEPSTELSQASEEHNTVMKAAAKAARKLVENELRESGLDAAGIELSLGVVDFERIVSGETDLAAELSEGLSKFPSGIEASTIVKVVSRRVGRTLRVNPELKSDDQPLLREVLAREKLQLQVELAGIGAQKFGEIASRDLFELISGGELARLVKSRKLTADQARLVRLTAAVDRLVSGDSETTAAVVAAAKGGSISGLTSWTTADWKRLLADQFSGDELEARAKQLHARVAAINPAAAILSEIGRPTTDQLRAAFGPASTGLAELDTRLHGLGVATVAKQRTSVAEKVAEVHRRFDAVVAATRSKKNGFALLDSSLSGSKSNRRKWARSYSILARDASWFVAFVRYLKRLQLLADDATSAGKLIGRGTRGPAELATDPDVPASVRRRASAVSAELTNALLTLIQLDDLPGRINNLKVPLTKTLDETPGFEGLFGDQTRCRCDDCKSVLGPAAHFVDLMRFIARHIGTKVPDSDSKSLRSRRADLWDLELNCANTNEIVAYLDLVNEVLKSYLVRAGQPTPLESLASERNGFELPFDFATERIDALLSHEHFTRSREEIAAAIELSDSARAAATLRLVAGEAKNLSGSLRGQSALRKIFRVPLSGVSGTLRDIDIRGLVRSTGLDRDTLALALTTQFVNSGGNVQLFATKRDPEKSFQNDIEYVRGATWLNLKHLERLLRAYFVIRRHPDTQWSFSELDLLLEALAPPNSKISVVSLARIVRLSRVLGLEPERMCVLIDATPTRSLAVGGPSLRARLFAGVTGQTWTTSVNLLTRRLNITADELAVHARAVGLAVDTDPTLDANSLDALYRRVLVAQGLDCSAQRLADLVMAAGSTLDTLEGIEAVVELHSWFAREAPALSVVFPAVSSDALDIVAWQASLTEAFAQIPSAGDQAEALRLWLAERLELSAERLKQELHLLRCSFSSADVVAARVDSTALAGTLANHERLRPLLTVFPFDQSIGAGSNPTPLVEILAARSEPLVADLTPRRFTLKDVRQLVDVSKALLDQDLRRRRGLARGEFVIPEMYDDTSFVAACKDLLGANPTSSVAWKDALGTVLFAGSAAIERVLTWDGTAVPSAPINALDAVFRRAFEARTLGVSSDRVLAIFSSTYADREEAYLALRAGLRLRFDTDDEFVQALSEIDERLRGRERDGLVAAVVALQRDGLESSDELSRYFLVDVLRGGCAKTSRVALAISSVRRYVDQIINEQERRDDDTLVEPNWIPQDEWAWRSAEEYWRAARRIFLFPENYLVADLRDDRTEPFIELQEELLATEITAESAAAAYRRYVRKVIELGQLRVAGAYREPDNKGGGKTVVLGVTPSDPPNLYYRFAELADNPNNDKWQPWRSIPLSIPSRIVSPILVGSELLCFWNSISTRPVTNFLQGESVLQGYRHTVKYGYARRLPTDEWDNPQSLAIDFSDVRLGRRSIVYDRFADDNALVSALSPAGDTSPPEAKARIQLMTLLASVPEGRGFVIKVRFEDPNRSYTFEPGEEPAYSGPTDLHWALLTFPVAVAALVVQHDFIVELQNSELYLANLDETLVIDEPFAIELDMPEPTKLVDLAPELADRITSQLLDDLEIELQPDAGRTPLMSTEPHYEADDTYTLERVEWTRAYPFARTGGERSVGLTVPGDLTSSARRFGVFDLDFVQRRGRVSNRPQIPLDGARRLFLDRNQRRLIAETPGSTVPSWLSQRDGYATRELYVDSDSVQSAQQLISTHTSADVSGVGSTSSVELLTEVPDSVSVHVVNGLLTDIAINTPRDALLLRRCSGTSYALTRLGTSVGDQLATAFSGDLDTALSLETQLSLAELDLPFKLDSEYVESSQAPQKRISFTSPMGVYFAELYFHIPMMLGDHLNAAGRYEDAQRWYEYLFDPNGDDPPIAPETAYDRTSRVWRSLYLRGRDDEPEGLAGLVNDEAAVAAYVADPFNPYAICRVRRSAFQRAVFIRYVKNMLDHADELFARFQTRTIDQAERIYTRVEQLLGERPFEIGECGESDSLSFTEIDEALDESSTEFGLQLEGEISRRRGTPLAADEDSLVERLLELSFDDDIINFERKRFANFDASLPTFTKVEVAMPPLGEGMGLTRASGGGRNNAQPTPTRRWNGLARELNRTRAVASGAMRRDASSVPAELGEQLLAGREDGQPVFCVPANDSLLGLWDRVEDRLWKIRHCRDIDGVRRQPPLFAPDIDPFALIEAGAGGASAGELVDALAGKFPAYRFSFLLAKAKEYTGLADAFARELQTALDRRDTEALARLRSAHEKALLSLDTSARELEIEAAKATLEGLERRRGLLEYRRTYHEELLATGLLPLETSEQTNLGAGAKLRLLAGQLEFVGSILQLIPEIGAPTAMKYGGIALGGAMRAVAGRVQVEAGYYEFLARAAASAAGFERRRDGWEHQIEVALRELAEIDSQVRGAELRLQQAELAKLTHTERLAQTDEVLNFYRDRFGSIGFHDWLATRLRTLYKTLYGNALNLARHAQAAFQLERPEAGPGLVPAPRWQGANEGVASAKQLQVALSNMELSYIEAASDPLNVTQRFPLSLVAPVELLRLQLSGVTGEFEIPKFLLNLHYPGAFRRRIKAVNLTIDAVSGPAVAIGATLKLRSSQFEARDGATVPVPSRDELVATSSAQVDGGRFTLRFEGDEKNPFEDAGVNSRWTLALPSRVRAFDYLSISDAVLEVSYAAAYDGTKRDGAETSVETAVTNMAVGVPIQQMLYFTRAFPGALAQLRAAAAADSVRVTLDQSWAPYFLRDVGALRAKVEIAGIVEQGGRAWDGGTLSRPAAGAVLDIDGSFIEIAVGVELPAEIDIVVPNRAGGPPLTDMRDVVMRVTYSR